MVKAKKAVQKYKINCSYTELVEPHKLVPNPKNPNRHTPEQIERLAKIIDYQGQRSSIVVSNLSGFIVTGHGRLEALKKLGFEKVAVDYQDFENEAQEYSHVVADNSMSEWSSLDLGAINTETLDLGPDFDLEMLGLKNFSIAPEGFDIEEDETDAESPKKFLLQVELPNDMELRDLYDDLISKGYMVREL